MKLIKIIMFLFVFSVKIFAQTNESQIVGTWFADKKDVKLQIFKNGNKYQGKLLWGNLVVEKDGITSKKDIKNPDTKLRNRNIIGSITLEGLKWDDGKYINGEIYNPPTGDTYSCKAWIENGKLHLRGYLGLSILGQTAVFSKIN